MLAMAAPASVAEAQSIIRVEIREEGGELPPLARGARERRMVKFMDELERPGEIVYDVHWEPPAGGLREPITAFLAYRQAGSRRPRGLMVSYPAGTSGRQVARFRVSEEQVLRWGEVTSWHIQLRRDDTVFDERRESREE